MRNFMMTTRQLRLARCVCVCVLGSILNSDIGFWQFVEIKLFVVCFELRRKDWRRKLVLKKCKRRMLLLGRK